MVVRGRASDPGADRGSCRSFQASSEADPATVEGPSFPHRQRGGHSCSQRHVPPSDSVHRQSDGHASCAFETGTYSRNNAENRGDSAGGRRLSSSSSSPSRMCTWRCLRFSSSQIADFPVVQQILVFTVQSVKKIAENLQLLVDVAVIMQRQVVAVI